MVKIKKIKQKRQLSANSKIKFLFYRPATYAMAKKYHDIQYTIKKIVYNICTMTDGQTNITCPEPQVIQLSTRMKEPMLKVFFSLGRSHTPSYPTIHQAPKNNIVAFAALS